MRVLTKSRFKLGLECPNKLFFTNKDSYANNKLEDSFLEALAQGGFQVEELARRMVPGGTLITGKDYDYERLWYKTRDILANDTAIIYEAAILYKNLFIRADILQKRGNTINLIEVKAKSYDPNDKAVFIGVRGGLKSEWKAYLFDLAFQKYVLQQRYPDYRINSFLMLADTSKVASVNGLNQLFRIKHSTDHRTGIEVIAKDTADFGDSILTQIDVTDIIKDIETDKYEYHHGVSFKESINTYLEAYEQDKYLNWPTSYLACRSCEFKTTAKEKFEGLDSGYEYCFKNQHKWKDTDFDKPAVIDIGGLYYKRGIEFFDKKKFFMSDLTQSDIKLKVEHDRLSNTERNWLQIEKAVQNDHTVFVNIDGLKKEMSSWKFPLHFIDFETSASALPFHKGRHPYEQIAFQFSHHKAHKDGSIEHASEYLNTKAGVFPNFDFIRALKVSLEGGNGSIFRYSNHENSILNAIYQQLTDSSEPDKQELLDFIQSISYSTRGSKTKWEGGERNMIDLLDVIKDYYYNPFTNGSNSIKAVLPAILKTSKKLQKKYTQPIGNLNISSKNFSKNHIWLSIDNDQVQSPYKNLPLIFDDWTEDTIEKSLSQIDTIADGGAALAAYGKLQYTDMTNPEIQKINQALLKYCELDTLAMVMIYEHFLELVTTN